jgi:hypothetical protein
MTPGERVGVIRYFDVDHNLVRFLGYGIFIGDGVMLDSGEKILEDEAWWSREDEINHWFRSKPQYKIENVDIRDIRSKPKESNIKSKIVVA